MAPLRIVYVITGLPAFGAEIMLYRLLQGLDRKHFEPTVISLLDGGCLKRDIEALGVHVHSVGMSAGVPSLRAFGKVISILRRIKPHIVHGWMYHGNLAAQIATLFLRQPRPRVFWGIHASWQRADAVKPLTGAIIRISAWLSRLPAAIVFVSHVSRLQHEKLGFCKSRGRIIPNAVDINQFAPSQTFRAEIRAELGIPGDSILIGLIGRFHPQKDHETFFHAAGLLLKRFPKIHFLLAGKNVDAGNDTLRCIINKYGLSEHIHLLGERRDMPRIAAAVDIATSSSCCTEALSLALIEAMACGVPCVVTEVGDSAILVGDTGIVVRPKDPVALAAGWEHLINAGASCRMAFGLRARDRIIKTYSIKGVVRAYEEMYTEAN